MTSESQGAVTGINMGTGLYVEICHTENFLVNASLNVPILLTSGILQHKTSALHRRDWLILQPQDVRPGGISLSCLSLEVTLIL